MQVFLPRRWRSSLAIVVTLVVGYFREHRNVEYGSQLTLNSYIVTIAAGESHVGSQESEGQMDDQLSLMDRRVLLALQQDADAPQKTLAYRAGISEPTFSKTVRTLRKKGIIERTAVVLNREKLGLGSLSFFTVLCESLAAAERVAAELKKDPHVLEVHVLDGDHPLLVKVCAPNNAGLSAWRSKVASLSDVQRVNALMVMRTDHETLHLPL